MGTSRKESEQQLRAMTADWVEQKGSMLFLPISMQQFATTQDFPPKGPIWVSRDVLKCPDDEQEISTVVSNAIQYLDSSSEPIRIFAAEDVKVQWTAFKSSGEVAERDACSSEEETYKSMESDLKSEAVVLYAHGGFYYTGSPAAARNVTLALARATGGRVLAVDYRLAPQHPFPAALIDLFIAYLSLLYPAPGSLHMPIPASKIVLAGESSGGNLVLSLIALLQHIRDIHDGSIILHGKVVKIPLPAGVGTVCAHGDHTLSFESHIRNLSNDIFILDLLPYLQPNFPACHLWPTCPPRGDIYTDISTLAHPLVSVSIAPAWSATDMPPMFFAYGQEKLTDEGIFMAKRAMAAGTVVQFSQYDALPHIFPLLFPKLEQSRHVMEAWGEFSRLVVESPGSLKGRSVRYGADDIAFTGEDLDVAIDLDLKSRMANMKAKLATREVWKGPVETAML